MKTLVIGARGFIGSHYFSRHQPTLGTYHQPLRGYTLLDLEKPSIVGWKLDGYTHALIAGGMNGVAACATEPQKSFRCNVSGPLLLGKLLLEKGITPIFLSSTYAVNPSNLYGEQKALLEASVGSMEALVIRLGKVYGVRKGDGTLIDEMVATLMHGMRLRAARDQILQPIEVGEAITQIETLQEEKALGLHEIQGEESLSRYALALTVAQALHLPAERVEPFFLYGSKRENEVSQRAPSTLNQHIQTLVGQYRL